MLSTLSSRSRIRLAGMPHWRAASLAALKELDKVIRSEADEALS